MHEEDVKARLVDAAIEIDDTIDWAMRLLRAAERGHDNVVSKCFRAYPALISIYQRGGSLEPIRQHPVFLNRASILKELHAVQHDEARGEGKEICMNRRSRIQLRLKKLKPG